jgi:hypothetical protein
VDRPWQQHKEGKMSAKRVLFMVLVASAVVLAVGAGPRTAGTVRALPPAPEPAAGTTIPYSGRLSDEAGQPVADGSYDLTFALYDGLAGGQLLWSEVQREVMVQDGAFVTMLGSVNGIPGDVLNGKERWLAVAVRGPGETNFTALAPRQQVSALPTVPDRVSAGPACPHDHFGEYWVGATSGWTFDGLKVENTTTNRTGIYGKADYGASSFGVHGTSTQGTGVCGYSDQGNGVYAEGQGSGNTHAALRANNTGSGVAAYLTNNSNFPTLEIDKTGSGGAAIDLQLFNPGNTDPAMFIKGYDENTVLQFLVSTSGIVAANGYIDWGGADVAEMLPAAKELEPGDVLAIGPDGNLIRSTEPYQPSVAGVYSTDPGFTFGHPLEGEIPGTIPLAITGVVPVKVSAENGPIRPGDLLVASATPGYAMRADPNPPQGTVIGKALEKWDADTGVIKMLATLQ